MPKIQPFEKYFQEYEDWFLKNNYIYQSELNAIKEFISPNKSGIEIGVGTGKFAFPLGIRTGVEPSPKMAEIARNRGMKVIEAVAENLPFEDKKFDFVLMVTAVCFFDDVQQAFKEAYRVLKPDGFIVVGLIDKNSELGKTYEKNKTKSKFYKEAAFHSIDDITQYLKDVGFKKFDYKQTIFTTENITQEVKNGHGEGSFIVICAKK